MRVDVRGQGLGRALVAAVLAEARGQVEQIRLGLNAANAPARHLYETAGFRAYGTEPAALRVNGKNHDELLMSRRLG